MISAQLPDAMRQISGLLQSGDYRAAHDRLEVIASTNPDYAEARRLLAGAKLALGDAAGAEQVLRAAAALDPVWPPTLTMLGELVLNGGRQTEAEQFLLRAATGAPADPRAALVLARRCNDTRRHAQALAVAAPFCVTGNAAPELATQHVTSLVALGRKDEAIAFYRRLAADSPDNAAAAHALAVALQAADRHGEAESVARRTRAREPQTAAFSYTHARSLVALGAFDRAEAALRDCLRADPQHVDAHGDLARLIWMRAGDSAEATAELDRALQSSPGNDALWAAKAAVLQGAGDPRAAYACLAARVERPQSPPALQVRAGLAALEFDPRIALERAERALRATPDDVAARTLQVAALLGVGAADAALYRLEAPPAWQSQADFLGDLKRSLEKLHAAHRHPLLFQSLRHGTETTEDLVHSGDPAVRALFGAFDAPIRDYIARMGQSDDPLRRRNTGAYHFNGSWSVRLRSDGFHHNHVHPRGWISSACYIDLPDSMADATTREGVLTFAEPGILTMPALAAQHEVRPEAGMLVLFPSYFWHGTVPISGEQTRLTVAFDAVPGR